MYITTATVCVHGCECMKSHYIHSIPNLLWLYYEWQEQQSILESYGSMGNTILIFYPHHVTTYPGFQANSFETLNL